jgi:hypothetical protein
MTVNLRPSWEGIGTGVIVVLLVLIFGGGIVRQVLRRRRGRGAATDVAENDPDADPAPDAARATDADPAPDAAARDRG